MTSSGSCVDELPNATVQQETKGRNRPHHRIRRMNKDGNKGVSYD
jgi:hypothetical protein